MKVCKICGVEKSLSDFYVQCSKRQRYQNNCKVCDNLDRKKYKRTPGTNHHVKKLQKLTREIKAASGCYFCEENDECALDFHHKDPQLKTNSIAKMVAIGVSVSKLLLEISKCEVICSNCHRKLHRGKLSLP